ncbi:enoyl-CoA hydratase [Rhodococcus sp. JS3073]|uniref:enoyl-CoA hydratase n=1 Tax=Rhodococcus sp. JS3073 TaxID=3002901 RepID=UPI002286530F|nr:enoyl-CoA hydratase [Rhodococcus sp. JS3073]WAM17989.1 enoyl-CoA hydratase [Rhodococcus sp. JS3073]
MGDFIRREDPAPGIARIVLARPQMRNAQSPELLYELDAAFAHATADSDVKVIVLASDGPDFSSGHDLKAGFTLPCAPVATLQSGLDAGGAEGHYAFECEAYLGLCKRWRDIPKPTIAQAQGRTIAGGLMLLWPMDIIVAADDATFSDPVTAFGVNGIEYFTHAWELGARKAKEILFTGRAMTAAEARGVGMVNHVVDATELDAFTLELAATVAARPAFGLRLAKESINRSLDAQGQSTALDSALALHNLGHAHNLAQHGQIVHPAGADVIRAAAQRRELTP